MWGFETFDCPTADLGIIVPVEGVKYRIALALLDIDKPRVRRYGNMSKTTHNTDLWGMIVDAENVTRKEVESEVKKVVEETRNGFVIHSWKADLE